MNSFFKIAEYLRTFKSIHSVQKETKEIVMQCIRSATGILLEEKDIKIRNASVFLEVSPAIKNEVFYKKKEILALCNKEKQGTIREIG